MKGGHCICKADWLVAGICRSTQICGRGLVPDRSEQCLTSNPRREPCGICIPRGVLHFEKRPTVAPKSRYSPLIPYDHTCEGCPIHVALSLTFSNVSCAWLKTDPILADHEAFRWLGMAGFECDATHLASLSSAAFKAISMLPCKWLSNSCCCGGSAQTTSGLYNTCGSRRARAPSHRRAGDDAGGLGLWQ